MAEFRTFSVFVKPEKTADDILHIATTGRERSYDDTETDIVLNLDHIVSVSKRGDETFIVTINSTWKSAVAFEFIAEALDMRYVRK